MNEEEVSPDDVQADGEVPQFAFMVLKTPDGNLQVNNAGKELSIDDIYSALQILIRNIEAQHTAGLVHQAMASAMMEAQGKRESGIVTPPGAKL